MTVTSLAVGLLLLLVLAWAVFAYNRLVRLRNQARTAWADIDVQLTRRHDLVPQRLGLTTGDVWLIATGLAILTGWTAARPAD